MKKRGWIVVIIIDLLAFAAFVLLRHFGVVPKTDDSLGIAYTVYAIVFFLGLVNYVR